MLTPNIHPLEGSVLPVCSYHPIGSCLRNSAHHQPPGRNTKPITKPDRGWRDLDLIPFPYSWQTSNPAPVADLLHPLHPDSKIFERTSENTQH
ncbi:hypothetical protein TNCV_672211 [Trichonephila clavipes]|nr:hypothetical protein TNCV_672211 [Trichonephila clavipes]